MATFLRIVDSILQTPVREYVRSEDGARVAVVGVSPVGAGRYYTQVRGLVQGFEDAGAEVVCEGPEQLLTDEHRASATAMELAALDARERVRVLTRSRIRLVGWRERAQALGVPPTWLVVDIDELELIRRIGPELVLRRAGKMIRALDWAERDRFGAKRFRLTVAVTTARAAASGHRWPENRRWSREDQVIIGDRTVVALASVTACGPGGNVVLVWGAKHLPGLHAGLTADGYALTAESWISVGHVLTVPAALLGFLRRTAPEPFDDLAVTPANARSPAAADRRGTQRRQR